MDFGALPGGAEGAKTFWGLSGVYKNTTQKENNAITDGCVAPLTMLLTIVIMYHKILSF